MAIPIVDIDIDLYRQHAASAWQTLNANYMDTVETAGFLPQLIEFFGSRQQVLKQFGGKTIRQILVAQAGYWQGKPGDPKFPFALAFRQQWGAWPNAFEVDLTTPWFTRGMTLAPQPEPQPTPSGFLDDLLAFVQDNPLVTGGIALGAFLILTKRLRV